MSPRIITTAAVVGLALVLTACEDEPIRTYTVPKARVIDPATMPARSASAKLTVKAPAHWQHVDDPSGMRAASYQAGEDKQAVTITAMALPAAGSNVQANVQRWAGEGQAELVDPTPDQLAAAVAPFESDHPESQYVTLNGPRLAVHGVIVPRGDWVWFFKMIGPVDQVAAQVEVFKTFVRTAKFESGGRP